MMKRYIGALAAAALLMTACDPICSVSSADRHTTYSYRYTNPDNSVTEGTVTTDGNGYADITVPPDLDCGRITWGRVAGPAMEESQV